jgi:hypothetical protein
VKERERLKRRKSEREREIYRNPKFANLANSIAILCLVKELTD